jgi:hypothetical protein
MGYRLLKGIAPSTLDELKVASNLGNSIFVETVDTESGPLKLVSAGSLLLDRDSFITTWIWLCIGGKYYAPLVNSQESSTDYVEKMRILNPEVWNYTNKEPSSYNIENFTGLIFAILNKRFNKMEKDEKLETFKRVIDELD